MARKDMEEVASMVDAGVKLHKDLGPGLLETVYEVVLAQILEQKGLRVERQKAVLIRYQGIKLEKGFPLDLLVEGELIIELKTVEAPHPVHPQQLLTYLRLMNPPLGLLINFGAPFMKNGPKCVVNNHKNFASPRLCMHKRKRWNDGVA